MILREQSIIHQNNSIQIKTNLKESVIQCVLNCETITGWMAEWLCSGLQSR